MLWTSICSIHWVLYKDLKQLDENCRIIHGNDCRFLYL